MALSGLDLALWDIAGKYAGKPVYELLGGLKKERVPAYYTSVNVRQGLSLGLKAFKMPVRERRAELGKLAERLASVRAAIGEDADLMIDCICTWDVETTLEAARLLDPVRLTFIEEPISPDDIEGYERLCREIKSTKIAHGEHEYTRHGFRALLRHRAAHILQPDLTWCGGLTEGRHIAAMARERGLPVIPHRGGSVFGMALILSHDNCPMAESFGIEEDDNELMQALRPPFEKGYYLPWKKPGFGAEVSSALIRAHAVTG
jgi:L-rhamnonate dehydratase